MNEIFLLDANVLIALMFTDHVHHQDATEWFLTNSIKFATCPMTQGSLIRFTLRKSSDGRNVAQKLLNDISAHENHEFWPDDQTCLSLPWSRIIGPQQVTDAYLVTLAKHHGSRLATFDKSLAVVFPEAYLVPTA